MLVFLGAEAMFFAGLISAIVVLRAGAGAWPPPDQPRFPVAVTAVNTLILLASGVAMVRARRAIRTGRPAALTQGLGLTAALGTTFLVIQGIEWVRLVTHGLNVSHGVYGGLFVAAISCHGLHVVGGVAAVAAAWVGARRRRFTPRDHATVTAVQLYWLFVVGVWPILYGLVYLW